MLASLATSTLLALASARAPEDAGAHEWNQPRGGPRCDSVCDVAPIVTVPSELWRYPAERVLAEPVCWNGTVYVLAKRGKDARVVALDDKTGKSLTSSAPIDLGEAPSIAVWNGFVAVQSTRGMTILARRGAQFAPAKKVIAGSFPYPPSIHAGYSFATRADGGLVCVELQSGELVAESSSGMGQPALHGLASDSALVGVGLFSGSARYVGLLLYFDEARVSGLGTAKVSFAPAERTRHTRFRLDALTWREMSRAFAARMHAGGTRDAGTWLVYSPQDLRTEKHGDARTAVMPSNLSPIATEPAVLGGTALGFSSDGALIRFHESGGFHDVLPADAPRPDGARRGRATIARGVLYLENWAVEIETGRILWCEPKIAPSSALLPFADGRALYVDGERALVCVGSAPNAGASAPSTEPTAASALESGTRKSRPSLPGSGEGVVLADGRRIGGAVRRTDDGRVHVTPAGADAQVFDSAEVALIETSERAERLERAGAEHAVYLAAWNALRAAWLDAALQRASEFAKYGFVEDARRLVDEAKTYGIDEEERRALERRWTGRASKTDASAKSQRSGLAKEESGAREASLAAFTKTADWCRAAGLPYAAAALAARAEALLPGQRAVRELARATMPPAFSERTLDSDVLRWMALADAILPVGGTLLARNDPAWTKLSAAPWNAGTLGLCTDNLRLFSRESDPRVVGDCLRNGELAVRALTRLLGAGAGEQGPLEPFEIRLHANREQYLAEEGEGGVKAAEWMGGHYSPLENVSRFYVTRDAGTDDPLQRDLQHVLVHELTHHFLSARWSGGKRDVHVAQVLQPGFWIVEGIARFTEDQIVEMDRRGERFDDHTVRSVDTTARVAEQNALIPLDKFLAGNRIVFGHLGDEPKVEVQLRHSLVSGKLSQRAIFYDQAGALVFFLMNHPDATRRVNVIEYLRRWYAGRVTTESWKLLGYEKAEDLEREFVTYLRSKS